MKLKLSKGELLPKGEAELQSRSKCALILWVNVCVEFMCQGFGAGRSSFLLGTTLGHPLLNDSSLWEEPTLKRFVKDGVLWVWPHPGVQEWGGRISRDMTGPILHPLWYLEEEVEEFGREFESGKKQWGWEKWILVLFLTILLCY